MRDTRSLTSSELYDLRIRAVNAVNSGKTIVEVAATFGISRQAVARWVNIAEINGRKILAPKQKGRPCGGKLKNKLGERIVKNIIHYLPDQLKLPFCLWTREAVASLIKRRYGIKLSVWTIGRLLKRWGLTPQKPARRAYEQDPKAVKLWLKNEYPKIKASARREKAIILWEDEMGLRSDASVGRTYGLKGKTPIVPVVGQRFGCNMIAGISNRGKLFFMIYTKLFTATLFILFLQRLCKQVNQTIFLIADGHPVHRAKKTKLWLEKNKQSIKLFFLPPYSPNLNPSEYLNQDVKTNTVRRKRPRNQKQMIANVRNYLRSKQKKPKKVAAYFHAKPVQYAAL